MKIRTARIYYQNQKDRRLQFVQMRQQGMTLQEIADSTGAKVSRQAVHQMLKRYAAAVDRRNGKA